MKQYTPKEWEAICQRCGKCCLIKLEDEDTGDVYYTDVVCRYFDEEQMSCTVYDKRCDLVPTCLKLSPENISQISWMPKSCAYRKLFDNSNLKLQSTIKGRVVHEEDVPEDELEDHIIDWEDL